jgi:sugar (pentulose or hexulose) kinase
MSASGPLPPESGAIAVFDLGKTNSKLLVFSADGRIVSEVRTGPAWIRRDGISVLDDAGLGGWMEEALARAVAEHGVTGLTVSGHGCTFALVAKGELLHPVLDYEQEPPAALAARADAEIPPFAETFSPRLPQGLNAGRHLLWLEDMAPEAFAAAEAILSYPQFWTWRLGGRPVSEVSYLGCHTHLWAPLAGDFSSLVERRGWRGRMPPFARAGAVVGSRRVTLPDGSERDVTVHNGVHDSNASLYFYQALGHDRFTMVSTGTWVIVMNPDCPLDALDPSRDMLANVSVDGNSVATARFMGGREFDVVSGYYKGSIGPGALAAVIEAGVFALPSHATGGPFPGRDGCIVGDTPQHELSAEERAAMAVLYVALMTDVLLSLTRSAGTIIVDGGLARIPAYVGLLAALRGEQDVLVGTNANGSASGAAALAFEAGGRRPFREDCHQVGPLALPGLEAYRERWRQLVAG